jgi:predicted glycogen debranching enzyme
MGTPLSATREVEVEARREWLVTNGLGGYACGVVEGPRTRRFHGLLVAALPPPLGRVMMLPLLVEEVEGVALGPALASFERQLGVPTWTYRLGDLTVRRTVRMPRGENTVHVSYRASRAVTLAARPLVGFRPHEAPLERAEVDVAAVRAGRGVELRGSGAFPPLALCVDPPGAGAFVDDPSMAGEVTHELESLRGYDHTGALASPGLVELRLAPDRVVTLVASAEPWARISVDAAAVAAADDARRAGLLAAAHPRARAGAAAELVLAADQFIVRTARGRTVIAGYPWFTDWGRDTMIALEGLALVTGRHAEAREILSTFARHVRDGLIPNLFPEGEAEGVYHTADATLWFLHALARYEALSGDASLVAELLPVAREIVARHVAGTRFGIHVDADGLLAQGAEGYALTWMDARMEDWVVTPRRGKPVEINALWYNGLRLVEGWLARAGDAAGARDASARAAAARRSFNARFWNAEAGCLLDVVDGPDGDDPACRPNQLLAISLPHPVLDPARWGSVLAVARARLLTPAGPRSLAPGEPGYQPRYAGVLRSRDGAYHQGTVWPWLIGPLVDAWLAFRPDGTDEARRMVEPLLAHLGEACAGSISEIFDAEPPHTPRGCFAQAWSVAEVLRALLRVSRTSP